MLIQVFFSLKCPSLAETSLNFCLNGVSLFVHSLRSREILHSLRPKVLASDLACVFSAAMFVDMCATQQVVENDWRSLWDCCVFHTVYYSSVVFMSFNTCKVYCLCQPYFPCTCSEGQIVCFFNEFSERYKRIFVIDSLIIHCCRAISWDIWSFFYNFYKE